MRSLTAEYLKRLSFKADHLAGLRTLGEFQGKQSLYFHQAPETLKTLREAAVVQSAESSNRIEGVVVAADRIEPLVFKQVDPRARSEQDQLLRHPGESWPRLARVGARPHALAGILLGRADPWLSRI